MAVTNISYQGIATSITMTMTSKGDGVWFSSALVDNQTNKYVDAFFGGSIQTGTQSGGSIDIYLAGSWDGTEFTAGVDAGNGTITWGTTGNTHLNGEFDLFPVARISLDANDDNVDIVFGPFSVASTFGGLMPLEWCVVIENNSGGTTSGTGTNNHLEYTGIEYDVV
ncbi:MAG: hypothetical protein ACYSUD_17185 [Planctomycetota bacterium]|jgi:hypothetical protein